jgi:outer membrane lipoprotein-sorting protein
MKMKTITFALAIAILSQVAGNRLASAQDAVEIMSKSHLAYYYAGNDGMSEVNMKIVDKKGSERVREFAMLRLDTEDGGDQKYYTYFRKPSDVSRIAFMVHKNSTGNDQRWIYVPSVDLVKPIAADDKNSSFVGSDFTYEDVSGRHWNEDSHTLVREDALDAKPVYVIESMPKKAYKGFAKRISFIDKSTFLPMREEYYDDKGDLGRVLRAEKIDVIDGITTVTVRSMESVKKGSKTTVSFTSIKYNLGLKPDLFAERYLKNPPRDYIKQ